MSKKTVSQNSRSRKSTALARADASIIAPASASAPPHEPAAVAIPISATRHRLGAVLVNRIQALAEQATSEALGGRAARAHHAITAAIDAAKMARKLGAFSADEYAQTLYDLATVRDSLSLIDDGDAQ